MSSAIALMLAVMLCIAMACLGIQAYLLFTKQLASPPEIVALAKSGNRIARAYVALFCAAVVCFFVVVAMAALR